MENRFLTRANELRTEITEHRRAIHRFGGVGFELRSSADYILAELAKIGVKAEEICPCGIAATIGSGGKAILLRGDYDALPMDEESGLPFAAENGSCHACGHDFHAAMLLGAAKLLKEREGELAGTVRLMFQPAEEILAGARAMIDAGLLENPKPDAAVAIHVGSGDENSQTGKVLYRYGPSSAAGDKFVVTVRGRGGHGAVPHLSIDPVSTASRIVTSIQQILALEIDSAERCVITFGMIHGGTAANIIPNEVTLSGTIRTYSKEVRAFAKQRFAEVARGIGAAMRCEVEVDFNYPNTPAVINDTALCQAIRPMIEAVTGPENTVLETDAPGLGSEDFAYVCDVVPGVMLGLGAGSVAQGYDKAMHNPAVRFDEDALPYGAAVYANVAFEWLAQAGSGK